MNLQELINNKGYPKIFFDSNNKQNQPFCIYELDEEIIFNNDGCFLNGKKIEQDPFNLLQECITRWKQSSNQIASIGFCSYNLKDYLFPHLNFKKYNDLIPFFWFAKPKKIYYLNNTDFKTHKTTLNQFKENINFTNYKKNISKIKSRLKIGDVYQINYTYTKKLKTNENINNIYFSIRNIAKPKYGWFIDLDYFQILCFSPERFFKIENQHIFSNPIKGTMPRSKDEKIDEKNKKILINSKKDKAENLMITDLIRNDLGKICEYGTVKVNNLFNILSFETVHHLESKISGKLKYSVNETDIFKAMFPGGSITGAPKESAMKIIDNLEHSSRELYTGSIGYIKSNGNMDFNIAIRTILNYNNILNYGVGGGIVWDSIPENEWEETHIKSKILNINK